MRDIVCSTLLDWRKLYAANRAVIEGRASGPAPVLPDLTALSERTSHPTALPDLPGLSGRSSAPARPGRRRASSHQEGLPPTAPSASAGTWEAFNHTDRSGPRPYFVYTPASARLGVATPLVVVLHGCTQTAASSAAGTLMNAAADRHGFVVAYPQQGREHNPQACWNWFVHAHQARGGGEPDFIAAVARAVMAGTSDRTIDPNRVLVAGMSAGGAMAAVMGATHPDVFAAVAIHSGLAFGSATNPGAAFAVMSRGAPDAARHGELAFRTMGDRARPIPTIVLHGGADRLVAPANGEHAVRQWMTTNRLASGSYDPDFERPASTEREQAPGGHSYTTRRWTDRRGRLVQEYVVVEGLGHAWSGGARGEPYADPRGPSAADAIWRFLGAATGT